MLKTRTQELLKKKNLEDFPKADFFLFYSIII